MTNKSKVDALSMQEFSENYYVRQKKVFPDLKYGSINILSDQDEDG